MCGGCRCGIGIGRYRCGISYMRRPPTREEVARELEGYAEELRRELAAVEERIRELRGQ